MKFNKKLKKLFVHNSKYYSYLFSLFEIFENENKSLPLNSNSQARLPNISNTQSNISPLNNTLGSQVKNKNLEKLKNCKEKQDKKRKEFKSKCSYPKSFQKDIVKVKNKIKNMSSSSANNTVINNHSNDPNNFKNTNNFNITNSIEETYPNNSSSLPMTRQNNITSISDFDDINLLTNPRFKHSYFSDPVKDPRFFLYRNYSTNTNSRELYIETSNLQKTNICTNHGNPHINFRITGLNSNTNSSSNYKRFSQEETENPYSQIHQQRENIDINTNDSLTKFSLTRKK